MINNSLKKMLRAGKTMYGTFLSCNAPDLVEICALAGFDFVVIDTEHGPFIIENVLHMIRAAEAKQITPIVRIPNRIESTILHILDAGAHGIQVPQVNDAKSASEVIGYAKYRPEGNRGIAFPRASDYAINGLSAYFAHENKETMIVAHCENKICLDNLEEICKLPEIDVVFLGPYDMSQSLGVSGQVTHVLVEDAAKRVLEVTGKYGIIAGVYAANGDIARERASQGFRYITIGMDSILFGAKCREELAKLNR